MLKWYAQQILQITQRIAKKNGSESELEAELNHLLRALLKEYGITYYPAVNETLKAKGLSQVDSQRPDSLFGHVVLDYKKAGKLSQPRHFTDAKAQVEGYLHEAVKSRGGSVEEAVKWAGVVWDGFTLAFCHFDGHKWHWTRAYPTSEASLLSLVQIYRSLKRQPLTAALLSEHFGKDSEAALAVLPVMCNLLSHPQHKTNMLFREWKRLFEQVSTYQLAQLPSLRKWSQKSGIGTQDASQILFALHSYYSVVVKVLTSELLGATKEAIQAGLRLQIPEKSGR